MGLWNISSRVATTGLVWLVALDVVLVGKALRSTHASGIDTSPAMSLVDGGSWLAVGDATMRSTDDLLT